MHNLQFFAQTRGVEFRREMWIRFERVQDTLSSLKLTLNSEYQPALFKNEFYTTWYRRFRFVAVWVEKYETVTKMSRGNGVYDAMMSKSGAHDNLCLLCETAQFVWDNTWCWMIIGKRCLHKDTVPVIIDSTNNIVDFRSIGFIEQYFALFDHRWAVWSCKPPFKFSRLDKRMDHSCLHLPCKCIIKDSD